MRFSIGALLALLALAAVSVRAVEPPPPYQDECIVGKMDVYNQSASQLIKWYTVNLDTEPMNRWDEIALAYQPQIQEMVNLIKNLTIPWAGTKLINWVDTYMGGWDDLIPQPYQDELKGISQTANINLGEIMLYNLFYEIFTVCTSIVAHDPQGKMYHARNLDFGLWMGWNHTTHDWDLFSRLQALVINVEFQQGGETLFKTVNFAGYVGAYNGVKKGAFTVSMNERFSLGEGGWVGIVEWLLGLTPNVNLCTFVVRDTLQYATDFTQAMASLMSKPILAPAYYILGGLNPQEAVIIARSRWGVVEYSMIGDLQNEDWYILQTNYDQSAPPLYIDDRRTPGVNCMNTLGAHNVSFAGLFNVLSSKNNLNKLTEFTVLMQVDSGEIETHYQYCPQPCFFA